MAVRFTCLTESRYGMFSHERSHFGDFIKCIFTILLHSEWSNFLSASKHRQTKVHRFVGICLYNCFIHLSTSKAMNAFGTTAVWWLRRTASQVCIKCRGLDLPVPKPVCFFFRRSESSLLLFLSCKVSFLFVFLGTVPKGLARNIFLARHNNSSGEHQALTSPLQ